MSAEAGTYEQINPANIVISHIKNSQQPRLCVFDKAYPIALELEGKALFGVDLVYGKRYMKFGVKSPTLAELFRQIEARLFQLVPGLKSSMFGNNIIHTLFDRDIQIFDRQLNTVSSFAIQKGSELTITTELGNIYTNKDGSATYKWMVRKIVVHI